METQAVVRYIRMSPRKARYVADLVRGKKVEEALDVLAFTHRRASKAISKLLKSAIANAGQTREHNPHATHLSTPFSSFTRTGLPRYDPGGSNFTSGYSIVNFGLNILRSVRDSPFKISGIYIFSQKFRSLVLLFRCFL